MAKSTNANDNEAKAKATETYKKVMAKIEEGGLIKDPNPSLINFMLEHNSNEYYVSYNCMSCNTYIAKSEVDPIERELCKSAFGGWSVWGTWEANMK